MPHPDRRTPLDAPRLAAGAARPWSIEVLPTAPSTNAVVREAARLGAPEGTVVVADHQTSGRGRLDRAWQTPPGTALTFSALLRPGAHGAPLERWPSLALAVGIAVSATVRDLGARAGVKWPNDVLVATADGEERKLCGILVEAADDAAIVGIGVNVAQTADELPSATAASLATLGVTVDRGDLLLALLDRLATAYADWCDDPGWLAPAYTACSMTLGREVRVELPGGEAFEGRAASLDELGRLVVMTGGGPRVVSAGDVIHARLL